MNALCSPRRWSKRSFPTEDRSRADHQGRRQIEGCRSGGLKLHARIQLCRSRGGKEKSAGKKIWELATADFVTLDAVPVSCIVRRRLAKTIIASVPSTTLPSFSSSSLMASLCPKQLMLRVSSAKTLTRSLSNCCGRAGALLKRENYRHNYPFCPRAEKDPLIQYARQSWFIRTTQFKEDFLANNALINWLPDHIKEGRFGDFLKNNVDWALSRERIGARPSDLAVRENRQAPKQSAVMPSCSRSRTSKVLMSGRRRSKLTQSCLSI